MSTFARQRQDLLDNHERIPYTDPINTHTRYIRLDKWIEGKQDDGEDGEFHTNFGIFATIDLDFKEIK